MGLNFTKMISIVVSATFAFI